MSSNIYKNYQVNMGLPFQIRVPASLQRESVIRDEELDSEVSEAAEEVLTPEMILKKAHEDGVMIVKEAELEALRILKEASAEAENIKKEIIEEARKQGYSDGYDQAVKQYESLVAEAEKLRAQSMEEHDKILAGIEAEAVEIILDIAKKVIGEEISQNSEAILMLVRDACEKCSNRETILLKVSPEDYDIVQEHLEEITQKVTGINKLEVRKDLSLAKGACVVETPFGSVDGGFETKLRKIEEEFMKALSN